jgi:integrase
VWHVRFYVDLPGLEARQRKSVPVGPCVGPKKLTKAEAQRKGAEVIASLGVNTEEHLKRATNYVTFKQRVEWCRNNKSAWTEGKPGPVATMESQLSKHILPRFGGWPLDMVDETAVQEFVTHLKRTTFEMRKPNGDLIKTYKLSRKTILNIVGVVKLVLGKKVWATWELDLGKPQKPQQPYFNDEQLQRIITASEGQNRMLFALLAGTGMRIGEAAGLRVDDLDLINCVITVRRAVWNGVEQSPKTENALREIDIDPALAAMLRQYVMGKTGRVFESQNGSPISGNNILKRVLHPLLKRLGIPKAGLHAFRHSRVTMLRKMGTPVDLQLQWVGHSALRTTDRYSHTDQELEYRRVNASKVGLSWLVSPNGPN